MEAPPDLSIARVGAGGDLRAVRDLCTGFIAWNRVRYAERPWLIERYYDPAGWERYLDRLVTFFTPPSGLMLLARVDRVPAGCAMVRFHTGSTCELKHLFVEAAYRGSGIGRRLCEEAMRLAGEAGFRSMSLETGAANHEAVALYESLGFRPCDAPNHYSEDIVAMMRFMTATL
jgi:ribosomal protein S18 acetylase RimI-like enzyme